MADAERGLGRPQRALELATSPEARSLSPDGKIELLIVEAGARRDLGQLDGAIATLQVPRLEQDRRSATTARLRVAYADLLAEAGRADEAQAWLHRAADVDPDGTSGALERLDENAEADFYDLEDDEQDLEDDEDANDEDANDEDANDEASNEEDSEEGEHPDADKSGDTSSGPVDGG